MTLGFHLHGYSVATRRDGQFGRWSELASRSSTASWPNVSPWKSPRVVAHTRLGYTLSWLGETGGRKHIEQAVELYDPSEHRSLAAVWGQDWGISARSLWAHSLLIRGYPERARHAPWFRVS